MTSACSPARGPQSRMICATALFVGLLSRAFHCEAGPPDQSENVSSQSKHDRIERALQEVHEKQRNVGLSVTVYFRGERVYSGVMGFADQEHQVRVTAATRFGIASVTKGFTGVALLKLHEGGKINLDAPIQQYLPDYPRKPGNGITPRMLAANLAGIRHWGEERTPALYATHFDDVAKVLPLFQGDPLVAEPGTKYSYSSPGYNVLAAAIQSAAGKPFQRYVEESILEPLELQNTRFDDTRRVIPNRSRRYSYYDPVTYAEGTELWRVPDWDYSHNMAGGNMLATADDLARYGHALVRPGLLTKSSLDLLYARPKMERAESPMSFGWFVSEAGVKPRKLHVTGANAGVQAAVHVYPEHELVVAILSNTWGLGSRSGEMVTTLPEKLAAIYMGWP